MINLSRFTTGLLFCGAAVCSAAVPAFAGAAVQTPAQQQQQSDAPAADIKKMQRGKPGDIHVDTSRQERRKESPAAVLRKDKASPADIRVGHQGQKRYSEAYPRPVIKADSNGDGIVDAAERAAWRKAGGDKLDVNRNGVLDEPEQLEKSRKPR